MSELSHTTGVKHEEHYGYSGKYHAGHEIAYFGGMEAKVFAGMETKLNVASGLGISLGTETHFGWGPEFKFHLGGASLGLAHASRPTYEDAFCATAGSDDLTYFHKIELYAKLMLRAQILAFIAEPIIKVFALKKNPESTAIAQEHTARALATQGILGNLVGLVGTFSIFIAKHYIGKNPVVPKSVVSINNTSRAFIGVRSSPLNPLTDGSSGLELNSTGFNLSFKPSSRDFVKTGDEYTGFSDHKDTAKIVAFEAGGSNNIEINSHVFKAECGKSYLTINRGSAALVTDKGGSDESSVVVNQHYVAMGFGSAHGISYSKLSKDSYELMIGATNMIEVTSDSCTIRALNGGTAKVSPTAAEIGFGANKFTANATGVSVSGGAIKIIHPTTGVQADAFAEIANIKADILKRATQQQLAEAQILLLAAQASALYRVNLTVDQVKRKTAAIIDKLQLAV